MVFFGDYSRTLPQNDPQIDLPFDLLVFRPRSKTPLSNGKWLAEGLDRVTNRSPDRWPEILDERLDGKEKKRTRRNLGARGPVRWPDIAVEGLDREKNRSPIRWPEP